mmetsp:Transcript_18972/g.44589  ORF Transcript_18972/g.44589 Transcript_18972/m.44589 type:complete len:224 (-) Transcript_18972:182-853(-)
MTCRSCTPQGLRALSGSQGELLDGVLASQQLSRDDADGRKHGKATVVELAVPHFVVVQTNSQRVAKVTRFLVRVLGPNPQLEATRRHQQQDHTITSRRRNHSREARWHALEAGDFDEVLGHSTHGRHHGHAAVLDLRRAQLAEALLIVWKTEASRVPVAQRLNSANLLSRHKVAQRLAWLRLLALHRRFHCGGVRALCQATGERQCSRGARYTKPWCHACWSQ